MMSNMRIFSMIKALLNKSGVKDVVLQESAQVLTNTADITDKDTMQLFTQFGKCKKYDKTSHTFLFIADTHGVYDVSEITDIAGHYEAVFLLGDITLQDLYPIMNAIPKDIPVYGILGNHNNFSLYGTYNNDPGVSRKIVFLQNKVHTIGDIKVAVFNGSVRYKASPERCMYTQQEMLNVMKEYESADIVIAHAGPAPSGYKNEAHQGFLAITKYIYKEHIPYCIHGHYHEEKTSKLLNGCTDICVYKTMPVTIK